MNNQQMNHENLMQLLPSVLDKDKGMHTLAETVSLNIETILAELQEAGIYFRIDKLQESLLDVLAEDLGIHWYDYDFKLETKRRVVQSSFDVHKHFGTKGAMVKAICAIWPTSSVEEWFEYSGNPYHFRVLVEANQEGGEPIRFNDIEKTVQLYKNARSWLQDDSVILKITCNVVIQTGQNSMKFHSVACGTFPRVSTHGKVLQSVVDVETAGEPVLYHSGHAGEYVAGTVPHSTTHGNVSQSDVDVNTASDPAVYHTGYAGEYSAGTVPHSFTHGDISDGGLVVGASAGESTYTSTPCGTPLGALM